MEILFNALNFREFINDQRLAKNYLKQQESKNSSVSTQKLNSINRTDGFLIFKTEDTQLKQELSMLRSRTRAINWKEQTQNSAKKFLINFMVDPMNDQNIKNIAMHPEILSKVVKYLGAVPRIVTCAIWYSPNEEFTGSSQIYHRDSDASSQVKLFIPLKEVAHNSGPFTFLDAKSSSLVYKKLSEQKGIGKDGISTRLKDSDAKSYSQIQATGDTDTIFLVDTSRCYHFGSRPCKDQENKPRLVLHIQYAKFNHKFSRFLGRKFKDSTTIEQVICARGMSKENHLLFKKERYKIISDFGFNDNKIT